LIIVGVFFMRQVLFAIPGTPIKLFGYGTMLTIAFLLALYLAAWRAKREKLNPEILMDLGFWVIVGGVLGARLFYVWQYWGTRIKTFWQIFEIWRGGIVLYGSIMGGAIAFLLYWFIRRFPLRPMLDAVAPSLALGIAIGRLGCFLNGCCYGDRCDLPWAVRFPAPSSPWADHVEHGWIDKASAWSLPIHPTQLYSTIDGLVLAFLLTMYYPLRKRDGEVMALLMVTYPITRFLIEWLRSDEGIFFAGMTVSQNISVLIFVCGLAFWTWLRAQPKTVYATEANAAQPIGVEVGTHTVLKSV
jgi:phosphatidylglycerol---prolipoprotein diacylglyceryl transferase